MNGEGKKFRGGGNFTSEKCHLQYNYYSCRLINETNTISHHFFIMYTITRKPWIPTVIFWGVGSFHLGWYITLTLKLTPNVVPTLHITFHSFREVGRAGGYHHPMPMLLQFLNHLFILWEGCISHSQCRSDPKCTF